MTTDLALALLALYIVVRLFHGVLNRMTRGVPSQVRCAISLLIVPGVAARIFSPITGEWGDWPDVLLLGGLALLFAVDRRVSDEAVTPRRQMLRLGMIVALVGAGLFSSYAQAQAEPPVLVDRADGSDGYPASLILYTTPCEKPELLKRAPSGSRADFHAGAMAYGKNQRAEGFWVLWNGRVLYYYSDGTMFNMPYGVPIEVFAPAEGS